MVQLHPTLVIGYGSYGLTAMRRLLTSAAPRGSLVWEDATGRNGPGHRRLRDLALIWVPEHSQGVEAGAKEDYLIKDLYRQIREIPADSKAPVELRDAVMEAKDRLLDASRQTSGAPRFRVGLDVVVLAQPDRAEVLGALEDTLQPAMEAMADDQSLKHPVQGAGLLNFIAVFDFDRYWSRDGSGVRQETFASIERWVKRQRDKKPAYSRIYFIDGESKSMGRRPPEMRIEETVLFLEFLLFEGQRDSVSLRRLYEREADDAHPLAGFGIRLIERSRGLLSRLAAAKFACGWLHYMAGAAAPDTDKVRATIRSRLEPFQPASFELKEEREQLVGQIQTGIRRIQDELVQHTAMNASRSDWPAEIRKSANAAILDLKGRISGWAGDRAAEIIRQRLGGMTAQLKACVTGALEAEPHPAPLGIVIEEVRRLLGSLEIEPEVRPGTGVVEGEPFAETEEVHQRYLRFCRKQVNPTGLLNTWWPLLAAVLGAAWTPVLMEGLTQLPAPDLDAPFLLRALHDGLQAMARPVIVLPILTVVFYCVGRYLAQRRVVYRVDRGKFAYTEPEQGELTDRIRKVVNDDLFQSSLAAYSEEIFSGMMRRVRSEIQRELAVILERLVARQKEMDWLREQLREFLRTYGIDASSRDFSFETARPQGGVHRFSIEREEDLRRILNRNPMEPARYQSTQAQLKPFRLWDQPYCETFLYPVVFLDRLASIFEEPREERLTGPDAGREREERAADLRSFIQRVGDIPSSMDWGSSEGQVPSLEAFAIIPGLWLDLPQLRNVLRDQGYIDQRLLTSNTDDRMHFLRIQTGISPQRLLEASPVASGGGD